MEGFGFTGASSSLANDGGNESKKKKKKKKKGGRGFQSMGLTKEVFTGVMRMGYKIPTPIQRKVLPIALAGADVVAMARTGSGKTAAFLIPTLERLRTHKPLYGVRALIISPTRELAQQTHKFMVSMGKFTTLKFCLIQGGDRLEAQFHALANSPDAVVCTPGRLAHLLEEVSDFKLGHIEVLVFDEADRLFEMGFAAQLHDIIRRCPESRQTLLFSATMPGQLVHFARAGLRDPQTIRLDTDTKISENLRLAFFVVRQDEKLTALVHLLSEVTKPDEQTIVFVSTRHHVEFVQILLAKALQLETSIAYGSMDMMARKENLARFRAGKTKVLVVTDVAARGLDIPLLNNVINVDCPPQSKLFVHRVGRAARQNRSGTAFTIVSRDEIPYMITIHDYLGRSLSSATGPFRFKDRMGNVKPIEGVDENDDDESAKTKVHARYSIDAMTPSDVHFGRLPNSVIDEGMELLKGIVDANPEVFTLRKVARNAHNLYTTTRPEASKKSIALSKQIEVPEIHPLFMDSTSQGEHNLDIYLSSLRNFRPSQTVFEVDQAKRGNGKRSAELTSMMKEKRSLHARSATVDHEAFSAADQAMASTAEAIKAAQAETAAAAPSVKAAPVSKRRMSKAERRRNAKRKATSQPVSIETATPKKKVAVDYRDRSQYIANAPGHYDAAMEEGLEMSRGGDTRLEDAILDLAADESAAIATQKRVHHWDKRKKKYIRATLSDLKSSKKLRNESGAVVRVKNRGELYEKWQQKHKRSVQSTGVSEEDTNALQFGDKFSGDIADSTNVRAIAKVVRQKRVNAGMSNELKDENTIRKDRKEAEKRRAKNARGKNAKERAEEKKNASKRGKSAIARKKGKPVPSTNRNARSRIVKRRGGKGGKGGRGRKRR